MTKHGPLTRQICERVRSGISCLLATCLFLVLPSIVAADGEATHEALLKISGKCVQTLLKLEGGRVFEGAEFKNVWKGRVRLSVDNVPVSFALNEDRFSGHTESCNFQTDGTTQRNWGHFAAQFVPQVEQLGLKRQRPLTETNFKFSGCADAEFGKSHLTVNAIYLMKSEQIVFSARSQRSGVKKCT